MCAPIQCKVFGNSENREIRIINASSVQLADETIILMSCTKDDALSLLEKNNFFIEIFWGRNAQYCLL